MNNNKLIAQALLEIARERGTTTFIDATDNDELISAAEKIGILLPSPDLAVFKTVYAEIDKANRNGVILPLAAVEKGLPTLIGKQLNWEHNSTGFICGFIIDASINEDKIEIIGIIFKSLFVEQMEQVKEKFASKEFTVSFEIWNRNPETGESVVKDLENGQRELSLIIFHGAGLLLEHKPACKTAIVYKLLAEKDKQNIFSEDLIYASLALEDTEESSYKCECLKCGKIINSEKHCKDIKCPACGGDMRRKDRPGTGQPTEKSEKKEDNKLEEIKVEEVVVETLKVEEVKAEEIKPEEVKLEVQDIKAEEPSAQVTPEPAQVVPPVEVKPEPAQVAEQPVEVKSEEIKDEVEVKPEVKAEEKSEVKAEEKKEEIVEVKFTQAEVEAKVNEAKAEAQKTIDAKDLEIKNLNETKDKEIENLKQELGKINQEKAKVEEKPEEESASLIVGDVEIPDNNETKQRANDIDKIIASKHQKQ